VGEEGGADDEDEERERMRPHPLYGTERPNTRSVPLPMG
jgi:hypothetical protein